MLGANELKLLPFLVSLIVSLAIALYAWQRRDVRGIRWYALYAFAQFLISGAYLLELFTPTLEGKHFWDDFQYIGTYGALYGGLVFVLVYTDSSLIKSQRIRFVIGALFVSSVIISITNPLHLLLATDYRIFLSDGINTLTYTFLPATYLITVFNYCVAMFVLIVLFRYGRKQRRLYRLQLLIISIGFLVPIFANLTAFFNVTYMGQRDITPLSFGVANIVIAWGLFRYRLFDIRPVAREVVVESMSASVLVFDEADRLLDWNLPAVQTILTNNKPVIGTPLYDVFAHWQPLLTQVSVTTTSVSEVSIEGQFLEVQVSPIYSRSNTTLGKVIVIQNITERVAVREELIQRTKDLEKANVELILARNTAEAADRAKSQFVSTISHELRNPLSAMMIFIQLVSAERHGTLNAKQKDSLAKALASGKHLHSLLNEVLDMTKIESGMMSLTFEDNVDLRDEIDTINSMMPTLLEGKEVDWIVEVDADLPLVPCDRRRIFQVMLNLVSNACKFTTHGTIVLQAKKLDVDQVLLSVRDTGEGIPIDDQELIFQPFKQSESGMRQASGTGLGLPICKYLIEAHKGQIWLESQPGKGATFYVKFPTNFSVASEVPIGDL